jgi:predicted transcriptional regulator
MKYMKYRTKTEIMGEILGIANGSTATKTKIMYQAYLSSNQMKEYLIVLTRSSMISLTHMLRQFRTTEKGLRFLKAYNQMSDVMKTEQQQHNNHQEQKAW